VLAFQHGSSATIFGGSFLLMDRRTDIGRQQRPCLRVAIASRGKTVSANLIILSQIIGRNATVMQWKASILSIICTLKRPDFWRSHNVDSNTKSTTLRPVINVKSTLLWRYVPVGIGRYGGKRVALVFLHTINRFFSHYFWIFNWPEYISDITSHAFVSISWASSYAEENCVV